MWELIYIICNFNSLSLIITRRTYSNFLPLPLKMSFNKPTESLKGNAADQLIKEYMKKQYRPYAVSDLVLNLKKEVSKVNAVKALNSLVEAGDLISKSSGKLSYYVYKEITFDEEESSSSFASEADIHRVKESNHELDLNISKLELGT